MERTLIEVHDLIHATPKKDFHLTEEEIRIIFSFVIQAPHIQGTRFGGTDADMHICDFPHDMFSMFTAEISPESADPAHPTVDAIGPWPMPLIQVADRIIHSVLNNALPHYIQGMSPAEALQALCSDYGPIKILSRKDITATYDGEAHVDMVDAPIGIIAIVPVNDSLQVTEVNAKQFMQ